MSMSIDELTALCANRLKQLKAAYISDLENGDGGKAILTESHPVWQNDVYLNSSNPFMTWGGLASVFDQTTRVYGDLVPSSRSVGHTDDFSRIMNTFVEEWAVWCENHDKARREWINYVKAYDAAYPAAFAGKGGNLHELPYEDLQNLEVWGFEYTHELSAGTAVHWDSNPARAVYLVRVKHHIAKRKDITEFIQP